MSKTGHHWVKTRLGDTQSTISTGPFGTMLHKSDYVEDGIPLVNPMNIVGSTIVPSTKMMVSEATKRRLENYALRKGDVVIARRGELGRCAVVTDAEDGWLCGTGSFFVRLPSSIDAQYFVTFFRSNAVKDVLDQNSIGTTMSNLNHGILNDLEIPLPPLKEQLRIMKVLEEAFEGIAAARVNIEKTLTKAKELLDIELQCLLTPPEDGWKALTLAEVASDYGRGKSKHRPRNDPKLYGGTYPFVQTGDVRNAGQYITTYSQTYNDLGLSQSKLWPKGTLCVTIAANIAETAILDFDACFPDSIIGIVANTAKANPRFIEYQLRLAKEQLQAKGKGSAQDNINLGTFETHTFLFPPLSVQEALVERLDSVASFSASLTDVLEQKLLLLNELEQSILSQAFSGNL